MKKGVIILATALAPLISKGNFANADQTQQLTKHQISLNLNKQKDSKDKNTFYVAGKKSHNGINQEPDTLVDHQTIITMNMDDILVKYGRERGLNLIRQHMLIEINMLRKSNGRPQLLLDSTLNLAAQQFAEQGNSKKKLGHSFDGKGIDIDFSKYSATAQNVAYDATATISSVVNDRYTKSEGHKKTMLGLRTSEYTGKTIPYTVLGIGISGPFIVAEFATPEK